MHSIMMKASAVSSGQDNKALKHKRRFCKVQGCERIVKSQGLCQRHGAKPRKCKVVGCSKQAQGNFDGMCKSHFKASTNDSIPLSIIQQPNNDASMPPPVVCESVYESIIPESVAWTQASGSLMPLVDHLKAGFDEGKPPAWHRNEERRARGFWPVSSPSAQLEGWERELVWTEILILTGNSDTSFRHLARAWGRDKGFQTVLAQFICERKGDVSRKAKAAQQHPQQPPQDAPLPWCVEVPRMQEEPYPNMSHQQHQARTRAYQRQEESNSGTSTSANTTQDEVQDRVPSSNNNNEEAWNVAQYRNESLRRNEELAADLFSYPQQGQANRVSRFASFEFDSAMLSQIDRDAEAIIHEDGGVDEDQNQKRQATL